MKRVVLGIVSVVSLLFGISAQAITVDDFDGQQVIQATPFSSNSGGVASSTAIGGNRSIRVDGLTGLAQLNISSVVTAGLYSHSQDTTVTGTSRVTWDGDSNNTLNPIGLGGLDFTQDGATAMQIEVLSFDLAGGQPLDITVTVYDSSDATGNKSSSGKFVLSSQVISSTTFSLPFSSFVATGANGGANFSSIGAISIFIDGKAPDVDLVIEWFGTNGKCRRLPDSAGKVIDECGVCGGDNSTCADCLGVPNGSAVKGSACTTTAPGVCAQGTYSSECACESNLQPSAEICDGLDNNCNGQTDEAFPLLGQGCGVGQGPCAISGKYVCDQTGQLLCDAIPKQPLVAACEASKGCDGVPNSGLVYDRCSVCGGNGTSCADCEGTAYGTAKSDRCGICNGDGNSCLGCSEIEQTPSLVILDGLAKSQEAVIKTIYGGVKKKTKSKAALKQIQSKLALTHTLQIRNWTLSWGLPRTSIVCSNTTFCSQASVNFILDEYRSHAAELKQLGLEALRKALATKSLSAARAKRFQKEIEGLYDTAIKLANKIPTYQSSCSAPGGES